MPPFYSLFRLFITLACFFSFPFNFYGQPANKFAGDVTMPAPNAASLGKYGDVPVSYFTGVPSISIPIHTVQSGPLSLPLSLNYHAGGSGLGSLLVGSAQVGVLMRDMPASLSWIKTASFTLSRNPMLKLSTW